MQVGDYVTVKTASPLKQRSGFVEEIIGNSFKIKGINVPYTKDDIISTETKKHDTAVKHDTGKNRLELIPVTAIEQIGLAMTFGAQKYEDNNWAKGFKWTRLVGSTLRHLLAWSRGENTDPESGLSHIAHCGACLCLLLAHEVEGLGEDDRRLS